MSASTIQGVLPWLLLAGYGVAFFLLAPSSREASGFYGGRDREGRSPGTLLLFATVFISWIFAKSVTNAANLAGSFGLPGAVAYGAYWLSIPVAGVVIVLLRTRFGARSLPSWVRGRYGRAAAGAFLLALLIRLYNEIWSNTAVVASYFGPRGSTAFYAAALAFTALTMFYTLKGGLRSSIFTDAVQAGLFALFLAAVVAVGLPAVGTGGARDAASSILATGEWTLAGGMDLLLVAVLQALSYPFHDPVLTDRGFLSDPRTTIRAFLLAGGLGFAAIVAFGGIGIPAHLQGLPFEDDAPRAVAASLGAGALLLVNVVMLTSAGSTLDSTFSSIAKAVDLDGREILSGATGPTGETDGAPGSGDGSLVGGRDVSLAGGAVGSARRGLGAGRWVMVGAAVVGNLPLFFGARILQATTISGTMVIGLAPVFVLGLVLRAPPASFHLAFWSGLAVGVAEAAGWVPRGLAVGEGTYASLLGANAWGLALVTVLFLLPVAVRRLARAGGAAEPSREVRSTPAEETA